MSAITLFGAGSWGMALSAHLAAAGRDVTLWTRRAETADLLRRTRFNPTYLSNLFLPASVEVTSDVEEAAAASDLWGMTVPSPYLRGVAERLQGHAREDVTVVSLAKGLEKDTLLTMSQVLDDVLADVPSEQIGTLYGPSHSEEVAHERPTTVVAAAPEEERAQQIQEAFITDTLRVYYGTDVLGVEVGGSTKNVLAIAAGISDAVGGGDNAKASLMTQGLAEIRRLGIAMGAEPETFSGLTGIGDLTVTCTSKHSRNRYFGEQIGEGKSLQEVRDSMDMVAEGAYTAHAVHDLAEKHDLDMPIAEAVYTLLFEDGDPETIVEDLLDQSGKYEDWLPRVRPEAASVS